MRPCEQLRGPLGNSLQGRKQPVSDQQCGSFRIDPADAAAVTST